jgi:hypothetical protein
LWRDAVFDEDVAHHQRFGRAVAADAAGGQEERAVAQRVVADGSLAVASRAFAAPPQAAAGRTIGAHGGAEDHDDVGHRRPRMQAGTGPRPGSSVGMKGRRMSTELAFWSRSCARSYE